ncbi:MAG: apolipoprotein N-acyltransferase [Elusimicrobia bacterium]|nr:apolipoprotein N-acyltransferase [Elusimicrobiota bacterium]
MKPLFRLPFSVSRVPIVLGACALAVTVPRVGLCPLGWAALSPFIAAALRAKGRREALKLGALYGVVLYSVVYFWVYSTCRFAELSPLVGALALLSMSLTLSLNWTLAALGIQRLRDRVPVELRPAAIAALAAGIELLWAKTLPEMGIFSIAYSQWRFLSWLQPISVTGTVGLTFLVVLVNASVAEWVVAEGARRAAALRRLAWPAALAGAWWACGAWMLHGAPTPGFWKTADPLTPDPVRKIAIVQPNVDQYAKWNPGRAAEIRANISELTERALSLGPDLILWPESSVPGWLDEPANWDWVFKSFKGPRPHFIIGAVTRDGRFAHNSAVSIAPDAKAAGLYHKRRLVPFGEYVPLRFLERWISILTQMGDMDPGAADQKLFETPLGKAGAGVCYESAFPYLVREPSAAGARLIVNVTNDGWYKDTWGPYQIFFLNRYRAIENRIYVARAANTGISGGFDPWGRTVAYQGVMTRALVVMEVPGDPIPRRSLYTRAGDWFGWLCALAAAAALLAPKRRGA